MSSLTLSARYTLITCCHKGCGITFAVPDWWETKRREDHSPWFCPNGHCQHFSGPTEAELLREQLEVERESALWAREDAENARRRAVSAEMSRRVTKGHLTRIKRRVGHGVCPACNRTVGQLARHMATKHPDFGNGE